MLTAFIALSALVQSDTVSFETTGAPVPAIVTKLAELTGRELVADLNLNQDILIVSLRDAREEDALKWIADAIDAEWREDKGKLRLSRPRTKELEQERKESAQILIDTRKRLSDLKVPAPIDKATVEKIVDVIKPMLADQDSYVNLPYELGSRTPMQRLVARIAKDIDFSQFMDLPIGVRIFVPFDERSFDGKLPRSMSGLLKDFRKEDEVYSLALAREGIDLGRTSGHSFQPGRWHEGPLQGAVSVARSSNMFDCLLVLRWGTEGQYVQQGLMLPPRDFRPLWTTVAHKEWDTPWSVPQLTKDFIALKSVKTTLVNMVPMAVPKNVLDYYTIDEDFDPFGLGTGQLLIDASKLIGKNIVACLHDSSAAQVRWVARYPDATVQQVMDRVVPSLLAVPTDLDGVLIYKPLRPAECRRERLPRETIRKIVKDSLRGFSDVSVFAEIASKCEPSEGFFDPRENLSPVTRMIHLKSYDDSNDLALRLYGRLSDAQRAEAKREGLFLPWAALQKAERTTWTYIVMFEGFVGFPGMFDTEQGPESDAMDRRIHALQEIAKRPQGPDGLLVRVVDTKALVGGSTSENNMNLQMIEERSLSSMFAHKELGVEGWEMDRFALLPYFEINVSVIAGGMEQPLAKYGESYAKEDLAMFGYESIPKSFIEARRKAIEEAKKHLRGGVPPTATPPSRR